MRLLHQHRPPRRLLDGPRRYVHSQQTVLDAVQEIRQRLIRISRASAASDVPESARNEAKALVANALQPPLASGNDVFFHGERRLTETEATILSQSSGRRLKGEPLAYVLGRKEFWSLEFQVNNDTLIPRSDSEVLIETLVDQFQRESRLRILDIGTGSGCLLLSALSEFPNATGVGVDISSGALAVAKRNAQANGLENRAEFLLRDLETFPRLPQDDVLYQRFDVILCNPPYIPSREIDLVGPDVLEYEPHLALFSDGGPTVVEHNGVDPEGLRMYRLLQQSVSSLFRNSSEGAVDTNHCSTGDGKVASNSARNCLLVEIGSEDQARAVESLFSGTNSAGNPPAEGNNDSILRFERFLLDASGKYRGLLFLAL